MSWKNVGPYVVAQLAGALRRRASCSVVLLQGFADFDAEGNMGQNAFGDAGSGYAWWAAFLLELRADRGLRDRDPRGHRRAQRAPRAGAAGDRPHPGRDPLRRDPRHRHLGQPGPVDRPGALRRHRRDRAAVAVHPRPAARRARSPGSPTRCSSAGAATPVPGSGLSFSRPRTAAQVPGYGAPTSTSSSGTRRRRRGRRRRRRAGRSSRTAGSGTRPASSGTRRHDAGAVAGPAGRRAGRPQSRQPASSRAAERRGEQQSARGRRRRRRHPDPARRSASATSAPAATDR